LKLFRTLLDHSNDAIEVVDPETLRFLDVNERACRDLGYSRRELLSLSAYDIDRALDPSSHARATEELQISGFLLQDGIHQRKDGSTFPVEINITRVQLDRRAYNVVIARDISERKQAQDALRRSEENYRMFVAQTSEGIFRYDLDAGIPVDLPEDELIHHILYDSHMAECNDAIVKMYGLASVKDFLGKRLTDTLDPNDPDNIELIRGYIRSGYRVLERESHEFDAHGNPKVFLNSMIGIVEDGKLICTWGIQRDITERLKLDRARLSAEEALRQSEERFRVALKSSPITVFNQDLDLRYTWIYNPVLYQHLQVLGKTDDEIIGPERAAGLNNLKRRVLETGVSSRQEVLVAHDQGKSSFDITIEPLRDSTGAVVGITGASIDVAKLRELADRLQEQRDKLAQEKLYLEHEIRSELGFEEIIGQSAALKEVLRQVRVVAKSDANVLLLGETGTGKELIARSVHRLSPRHDKNFIRLNCAAIPTGLLESELFGHEKGAFTGAVSQKLGRLELADKGTIFLDEIGELPLELQPKLLRVLQDHEFERLGGVRTLRVDVRIVAATNADLRRNISEKKFREDLFYRINVFPIHLPALRERRADIQLLADHFLRKHSARMNKHVQTIPAETLQVLTNWGWPGNIRELENLIERLVILTTGPMLVLPPAEFDALREGSPSAALREVEREHILRVLRKTNGILAGPNGAASLLGLKRTTLQSMMKRLHIEPEECGQ
ncbi:MAG: sigma 54-interacting transcriptional regulator, partial [Candidatus Sulfotelmatobacter sp.]